MTEIWIAISIDTNRIVGIGSQSEAKKAGNQHQTLSNNKVKLRKLKVGMIIYE